MSYALTFRKHLNPEYMSNNDRHVYLSKQDYSVSTSVLSKPVSVSQAPPYYFCFVKQAILWNRGQNYALSTCVRTPVTLQF